MPKELQISEIEVRDRAVRVELESKSRGRDWERTREVSEVGGRRQLVVRATKEAIGFFAKRSRSDAQLREIPPDRLAAVDSLRALEDGRICVAYGSITSIGYLVLGSHGPGFGVESVTPPPNWGEGRTITDCGSALDFEVRPEPQPPLCRQADR